MNNRIRGFRLPKDWQLQKGADCDFRWICITLSNHMFTRKYSFLTVFIDINWVLRLFVKVLHDVALDSVDFYQNLLYEVNAWIIRAFLDLTLIIRRKGAGVIEQHEMQWTNFGNSYDAYTFENIFSNFGYEDIVIINTGHVYTWFNVLQDLR